MTTFFFFLVSSAFFDFVLSKKSPQYRTIDNIRKRKVVMYITSMIYRFLCLIFLLYVASVPIFIGANLLVEIYVLRILFVLWNAKQKQLNVAENKNKPVGGNFTPVVTKARYNIQPKIRSSTKITKTTMMKSWKINLYKNHFMVKIMFSLIPHLLWDL
ncbi:hypothetical protein RFI_36256 [Reticulomyxa filosa]|uniref:Uncharacterized protein n=1 Tax=Reticulomyxa filosa TaxID=46433 RepID=X6LHT7_RETFI|nr:hypothetical protein RFI_36256 [Reticulomyxa filosa]|eukprot:ETO01184.1 hypothetical protein RFI_36256 [Reticulomyxa filosa]